MFNLCYDSFAFVIYTLTFLEVHLQLYFWQMLIQFTAGAAQGNIQDQSCLAIIWHFVNEFSFAAAFAASSLLRFLLGVLS